MSSKNSSGKRVVVVGAGVSGLSAAYRLRQLTPDLDITVLEQNARVGGNAWTEREAGYQVEIGPNGLLDSKPTTIQLCRDAGLGEQLLPASDAAGKNRYLFLDGKLKRLPGGLGAFLASDLLSWRGKLHFFAERFRPPRTNNRDESIDAFVRRRAGAEVAEVFADALVTGIHGGDPTLLSMAAAFPRLTALEREYGSVLKGLGREARRRQQGVPRARMWSFAAGMRLLVETLRDRLAKPPVLGVQVRAIERQGDGWRVRGAGADCWLADAVLLTCPAYRQAAMLDALDHDLAEQIGGIAYNRIAVVALGYRREDVPMPLDGFGYIAPQRFHRDLLGVQWCSSIFPERAPPGHVLLRALCGGWHRAEVVGWDDARLLEAVRAELRQALRVEAAPRFQRIVRWDRAIPQYRIGHLERVAKIEERVGRYPGLFLGGNAYHGVALNDCTEQGQMLAERIRRFLAG